MLVSTVIYRGLSVLVTGYNGLAYFSAHSGGRGSFLLTRDLILLEVGTKTIQTHFDLNVLNKISRRNILCGFYSGGVASLVTFSKFGAI